MKCCLRWQTFRVVNGDIPMEIRVSWCTMTSKKEINTKLGVYSHEERREKWTCEMMGDFVWWQDRCQCFHRFLVASLSNQTTRDFILDRTHWKTSITRKRNEEESESIQKPHEQPQHSQNTMVYCARLEVVERKKENEERSTGYK